MPPPTPPRAPFANGMTRPDHGRRALDVAMRTAGPAAYDAQNPDTSNLRNIVTPIRAELPPFETRRAYVEKIAMPSAITAGAGDALWFGLLRITPATFGQEFVLSGGSISLRPCDTDNTYNAGDGIAWGDILGYGARIIVGDSLPFGAVRNWEARPAPSAFLCASAGASVAPGLVNADSSPNWIHEQAFPTGKLADTNAAMIERDIPTGADQYRIVAGRSLDVALVVRQTAGLIAAGSGKFLYARILVTLRLGQTRNVNQVFRST